MSDTADLLARYDAYLRTEAEMYDADRWERLGPLYIGIFGNEGFVTHADLALWTESGAAIKSVAEWVRAGTDYFEQRLEIAEVEWKTRSHDRAAAELELALRDNGWMQQETETVLLGPAAGLATPVDLPEGVELVRIDSGEEPHVERWQAICGDEVITTGRIAFAPNSDFAGLWGGSTEPQWRGKGIYRALTAQRAQVALARGAQYLYADCSDMSRPILERSGLSPITATTPWIWRRP